MTGLFRLLCSTPLCCATICGMAGAAQTLDLRDLIAALGGVDPAPLWKQIELLLISSTIQNFQNETSPDGSPWAPLKHPRRRGPAGQAKILQDTGVLRASMASAFASDGISQLRGDTLEWGTNVPYGGFHQHGTKKMVARPFLGMNDQLADDIEEMVADFFEKELQVRP